MAFYPVIMDRHGKCDFCLEPLTKGDRIYFSPDSQQRMCELCADEEEYENAHEEAVAGWLVDP